MRPVENGLACQSERCNLFSVLHEQRFNTPWQYSDRTLEPEHVGIWDFADIGLVPQRRQRVVFYPVNGAL